MELEQAKGFLNTPSLWEGTLFEMAQFDFPEIDFTHFTPTAIPKNIRLGHQIEHLFYQLLAFSKAYKIILFNQPIKRDKITIGEIDYIVQNTENESITHVELTYKFYIIDPTIPETIHQFIGPNRRDSFYEKLEKIKNKQFKLIHTSEAINELKGNGINIKKIVSKVCFKAQLFTPYHQKEINCAPFDVKCIVGYWLRLNDFYRSEFCTKEFYLPTKPEWILAPHTQVAWQSFTTILLAILERHAQKNAPMVWMKKSTTSVEKFFVVWW